MKKIFRCLLLAIGLSTSGNASAQTIEQASARHQQFNLLRAQGADDTEIYSALHQCYNDYVAVLNASTANGAAYMQAQKGLLEIHPFLRNGAAYFSSRGVQQNALIFAQAYMDVPLMEAFKHTTFVKDEQFVTMAYFAAAGTFNIRDYEKAINYFRVYLSTGDQKNRQNVYAYMAKACMNLKKYELAKSVLDEAITQYPSDFNMLSMAINTCIEQEDNVNLQRYVTRALEIKPYDETLLNIQGKLYEDTQEFQKALVIYKKMKERKPNSLNIMQHIALNYYNLGVLYYNKASLETEERSAKKYSSQSGEYFKEAAICLETIVANSPNSVKYMQALAIAYDCMGNDSGFETVNGKLAGIGAQTVAANSTPTLITHSSKSSTATSLGSAAASSYTAASSVTQPTPSQSVPLGQQVQATDEVPLYSAYAKEYAEKRIKTWQAKDPYETIAEYQARVTEQNRDIKVKELLKSAESEYIKTYTQRVRINDLQLKPYDAEHEVFLVESKYGDFIVPVPRDNNEARIFESSWNGMQCKDPQFYINNDKLTLASLTFVTPTGNSYRYDANKELNYTETVVDVSFDPINSELIATNTATSNTSGAKISRQSVKVGAVKSDVDVNIPESKTKRDNLYALIIANENYNMVSGVPFALNDGEMFAQYCEKTLGLPEKNVLLYKDASYGIMLNAMDKVKKLAAARGGDMELIFYYAGHGIPDESSKDAFLLPVDSDGKQTKVCYSLGEIYRELGALDTRGVTVFLDACFSGAKRDGGMVAEARGVAIKPKPTAPKGNMVVFSAVSDDETALPYEEKGHGMFTYFLLKKLQETKGNVTLKDLGDYLKQKVMSESILVNDKSQTPTVTASDAANTDWYRKKLYSL